MSTREVIFGDTLDTVYTDDIGISRAVKLKEIETDKKMEMEALALEKRDICPISTQTESK